MKTLAILILILSAAYISEAGKGRKNKPQEAVAEEVEPEVEEEPGKTKSLNVLDIF